MFHKSIRKLIKINIIELSIEYKKYSYFRNNSNLRELYTKYIVC